MPSSHSPDTLVVGFDDDHAVANAGLLLPATPAQRLGVEQVVDELVNLGDRPGHHRPGRKVLTLVHALAAGGDGIDDTDVLRTGSTGEVLGHQVMAPSTLGRFLGSFTFGHVRQLDQAAETVMGRAWAADAGPGEGPMTMDVDSTICEVTATTRAAPPTATPASSATTRYWPPAPTPARCSRARQRTGRAASGRGTERFVNELAGRVRRAGATGQLTLRADSGFWSAKVLAACRRHRIRFSITVRQISTVTAAIASIPEHAWTDIDYPTAGSRRSPRPPLAATG